MSRNIIWPTLQAGAVYEGKYLLGTSFARPHYRQSVWWKSPRPRAPTPSATAAPVRATIRFALNWRSRPLPPTCPSSPPGGFGISRSRDEEIDYAEAHNIPLKITRETNYSKDKNLWHLSHEGLDLENPENEPKYDKILGDGRFPGAGSGSARPM